MRILFFLTFALNSTLLVTYDLRRLLNDLFSVSLSFDGLNNIVFKEMIENVII